MKYVLGLLIAVPAFCTTTIVSVSPSATQAIIAFTTDQTVSTCTFRATEGSSLGTMVPDVNASLYTGSNTATRVITVGSVNYFVLGTRGYFLASDGKNYSRALHAQSLYSFGAACGSDSEQTTAFNTTNAPPATPPEAIQFDSGSFGNYAQPTIDYTDPSKTYIDARTGLKISRISDAADTAGADASLYNQTPGTPVDISSAWTTPSNITGTSGFASVSSTGKLFLPFPVTGTYPVNTLYDGMFNLPTNFRLNLNGYGSNTSGADTTVSACPSSDNGATCACPAIDLPAFPQGSGSAAVESFPSSGWPSVRFASWCTMQPPALSAPKLVTVSGVGTFGILIQKKNANGSISLNTARYDVIYYSQMGIPDGGETRQCSKNYRDVTVDRNGGALGYTQHGYFCTFEDNSKNQRFYWVGTNGEGRFIGRLLTTAVSGSSGGKDDTARKDACTIHNGVAQEAVFDASDPNTLYCISTTAGSTYSVVLKITYNFGNPSCDGRAWSDPTFAQSGGVFTTENPCLTVTNITKASLNQDLTSQMVTLVPSFKSAYFTDWAADGPGGQPQMMLVVKKGQNSIGWFARFDIPTATIVQAKSSYDPYHGNIHGGSGAAGSYGSLYVSTNTAPNTTAVGQELFNITAIQGLGSTDLTNTYVDALTCEALGVTNPVFIAQGATGRQCIKAHVDSLGAYNSNPSATDLATFPHPKNSTACGGDNSTGNCYSQISHLYEGNEFVDNTGGFGEHLRIVKDLGGSDYVFQRGVLLSCGNSGMTSHTSWTPTLWVAQTCGAGQATFHWIDSSGNVSIDQNAMNQGHHDFLVPDGTNAGTYVQSDYDFRTGTIASQIGQGPTWSSANQYNPKFNGSTAGVNVSSIQSHLSASNESAVPNERRYMIDGRPLGGSTGGNPFLGYQVPTSCGTLHGCTATNAAATDVYKVGLLTDGPGGTGTVLSTLDRKNLPVWGWAGPNLLQDISGPSSNIAAAANFSLCVADFAGECIAGSSAGDVFEKVPNADTAGIAKTTMDTNVPGWVSATPILNSATQIGIDRVDSNGTYWRSLGNFFQGIGWMNNFWNVHPAPDGSFAWATSRWLNGLGSDVMAVTLPTWPTVSDTTGAAYVPILVPITGNAQPYARIKFGYAENGSVGSYYCMQRQEACVTDNVWDGTTATVPFKWVSETQTKQSCSPTCTIKVPVMLGRVAYMTAEYLDSSGTVISSSVLAPVTVPFNDVQTGAATGRRISGSTRIYGTR